MEKTIDFGNENYLKVQNDNITVVSGNKEFHYKLEDFFKYLTNPISHNNLVQEFREYCIAKEKKYNLIVKDKFAGKKLIFSNNSDVCIREKYAYGADVFIDECSDDLSKCKNIDECLEFLDNYFSEEETLGDWIDTERINLEKKIDDAIIIIGNIRRWNGKYIGYRIMTSNYLGDVLTFEKDCYIGSWFVDTETHDLCSIQSHHDGTHYLKYYACSDVDAFEDAFAENKDYMKYLHKLGPEVEKIYGWEK